MSLKRLQRVAAPAKVHPLDLDPARLVGFEALESLVYQLAEGEVSEADYEGLAAQLLALADANDVQRDSTYLSSFASGIGWRLFPDIPRMPEDGFWRTSGYLHGRLAHVQHPLRNRPSGPPKKPGIQMVPWLALRLRRDPMLSALAWRLQALTFELGHHFQPPLFNAPTPKVHPLDLDPSSLVGGEALAALLAELARVDIGVAEYERVADQLLLMAGANDVHRDCNNLVGFACGIALWLFPGAPAAPEDGFMPSSRGKDWRIARAQDDDLLMVESPQIGTIEQQCALMVSFLATYLGNEPYFAAMSERLEAICDEPGRLPKYSIYEH